MPLDLRSAPGQNERSIAHSYEFYVGDLSAAPIGGATVKHFGVDGSVVSTSTDRQGYFRTDSLPRIVWITHPNHTSHFGIILSAETGPITLARTGSIKVVVRDEFGGAVGDLPLNLIPTECASAHWRPAYSRWLQAYFVRRVSPELSALFLDSTGVGLRQAVFARIETLRRDLGQQSQDDLFVLLQKPDFWSRRTGIDGSARWDGLPEGSSWHLGSVPKIPLDFTPAAPPAFLNRGGDGISGPVTVVGGADSTIEVVYRAQACIAGILASSFGESDSVADSASGEVSVYRKHIGEPGSTETWVLETASRVIPGDFFVFEGLRGGDYQLRAVYRSEDGGASRISFGIATATVSKGEFHDIGTLLQRNDTGVVKIIPNFVDSGGRRLRLDEVWNDPSAASLELGIASEREGAFYGGNLMGMTRISCASGATLAGLAEGSYRFSLDFPFDGVPFRSGWRMTPASQRYKVDIGSEGEVELEVRMTQQ